MVEQLLLQEEIRFVSNLQKISFQEFQRDAETLPLDLWKKSVRTGLQSQYDAGASIVLQVLGLMLE